MMVDRKTAEAMERMAALAAIGQTVLDAVRESGLLRPPRRRIRQRTRRTNSQAAPVEPRVRRRPTVVTAD